MSKLFDWMQKQGKAEPICIGCRLWHELDGCLMNIELEADAPICQHFGLPLENPKCQDCVYFDNDTHNESFGFLCHKLLWCEPGTPAEDCSHFREDYKDSRMYAKALIEKERKEEENDSHHEIKL